MLSRPEQLIGTRDPKLNKERFAKLNGDLLRGLKVGETSTKHRYKPVDQKGSDKTNKM